MRARAITPIPVSTDCAELAGKSVDILIVGGGVAGCALAYYLARAGADIMLIERDDLNSGASGANAGSLHLQLTAPFFTQTHRDQVTRSASILIPLSIEAIQVWHDLSTRLSRDIEFKIGGGLMVAETDEQLKLLEKKVKAERRAGLETEILSRVDLDTVAPYLSTGIIGAAFSPGEGRVNPLAATLALAEAAVESGAEIHRQTALVRLQRRATGFMAETTQGTVSSRCIVNAAGSSAGIVASMLGADVPVVSRPQHMNVTEATAEIVSHLVQHVGRRLTLKQAANGCIIIGGGLPGQLDGDTGRVSVVKSSFQTSTNNALRVVPAIGGLRVARSWCGQALITDGNPILGEHPQISGFFYVIPSSSGYTTGPICARLLSEVILGQRRAVDLNAYSIERFADPVRSAHNSL